MSHRQSTSVTQPKFSICIPYHRNEAYLIEAVESVIKQTYIHWELFVSLDSELSESTIKRLRLMVPDIILDVNPNPGMTGNWNHCIAKATSEYCIILHSDDRLLPNYLSLMSRMVATQSASAWFCGVELIDNKGLPNRTFADTVKTYIAPAEDTYLLKGDFGLNNLLLGCFIYCPTVCYRTSIVRHFPFSDSWKMVADLELYARLLAEGHTIFGTKETQFQYRRHSDNQTSLLTHSTERFKEELELYERVATHATYAHMHKSKVTARRKTIVKLHMFYAALKSLLTLDFLMFKKIVSLWFTKS